MVTKKGLDRRGFLGLTAAGAALTLFSGCELEGVSEDSFGMHGPVRLDPKYFVLPRAESAEALFAPYENGEPFSGRWALAHVGRGHEEQLIVVVVDTETGGHAELEVYAADRAIHPLAASDHYHVHLNDGGQGDKKTPLHMERLARKLAEIIRNNESRVVVDWKVSTHLVAQRKRFGPKEGPE